MYSYITPEEYERNLIMKAPKLSRKKGNQGRKGDKTIYKNLIISFDIETTRLTKEDHPDLCGKIINKNGILQDDKSGEQSIMWVWMLHIHHYCTIVGRTWEQLSWLFSRFCKELGENEKLVIWVHNLSYEFQFLKAIHNFQQEEVFAVESRKVLKCFIDKIEFRCSYLHSNMSLAEYTNKMQVEHRKLVGELDYTKKRFPWTPIDPNDLPYCLNDVIGLCEAIEKEMEIDGDDLYSIPLTSTGYVRRDVRRSMYKISKYIKGVLPPYEVFKMLREAFSGGDTHANRYYVGRVIDNVKSADRSSSYPEVQCNELFPIGRWCVASGEVNIERYFRLIDLGKAIVMRVAFTGLELSDIYEGCPYISRSHCRNVSNAVLDNGRILSCDYMEITITDVDFDIITEQYKYTDLVIIDLAYSRYGKLPEEMTKWAKEYYRRKTEMKGIEELEIYYNKAKALLNAIYGMTAQNPAKEEIIYMLGDFILDPEYTEKSAFEKALEHAFLSYAWGVWTTAHARHALHEGIKCVGTRNFIYCDTDSVKYIGEGDFTHYNEGRVEASKKSGAYATDKNGITHYMGVFEQERTYTKFATLGAKKYAYQYEDGKTHVTIAGVTKKSGGVELDENGGIETFSNALEKPFTFYKAGGTEIKYQDNPQVKELFIDGHILKITPNAVIRESTYTLGVTAEYMQIIESGRIFGFDIWRNEV